MIDSHWQPSLLMFSVLVYTALSRLNQMQQVGNSNVHTEATWFMKIGELAILVKCLTFTELSSVLLICHNNVQSNSPQRPPWGQRKENSKTGGFVYTVRQLLINWLSVESLFRVVWDALYWPLLLWGGGRFKELKIRKNVWSVLQDENKWSLQRGDCFRKRAVSGCSFN